ncbi:MAG: S8 family serine peptidase [Fusicatenibacter saccharivorans]
MKPDFAAPGVSVTGPGPAGSYVSFSGSSASAAITSGAAALFLQWGIQRTPARYFTAQEVKNYLIRGADRTDTITYPSREWGYGRLQLYQSFTSLMTN